MKEFWFVILIILCLFVTNVFKSDTKLVEKDNWIQQRNHFLKTEENLWPFQSMFSSVCLGGFFLGGLCPTLEMYFFGRFIKLYLQAVEGVCVLFDPACITLKGSRCYYGLLWTVGMLTLNSHGFHGFSCPTLLLNDSRWTFNCGIQFTAQNGENTLLAA